MGNSRENVLQSLDSGRNHFDLVVIGGGITGAGVAREAAGSGLRTLLVEQRDFAWGTSSRSSKMVHGGLRYLGSGHIRLTRDAVQERQRLMSEAPGLVDPLQFVMPHYRRQFPGPRLFQLLLRGYDRIARIKSRRLLNATEAVQWVPGLANDQLAGASVFTDAVTDDTRLVQRVIAEARRDGALCLNYVRAMEVLRGDDGQVSGLTLQAEESDQPITVNTPAVINATGAWAERLANSGNPTQPFHIRPLRGSHLVLPWNRLPVSCSVSLLHPDDGRPVFAFPWQGTTVLGTTDLDHPDDLNAEPSISNQEVSYLLRVANRLFPCLPIGAADVISTWAGVRPVVTDGSGKAPSKENREHQLRSDRGLVSIAGGKLTTFRLIAREALLAAFTGNEGFTLRDEHLPVFRPVATISRPRGIGHLTWRRLRGYFGDSLPDVLASGPNTCVFTAHAGQSLLWAEVYWACQREDIVHLDDLLLRRTRLGLILEQGGQALLPELRQRCQPLLGWSDERWHQEESRYARIYSEAYALPALGSSHVQ